MATTSEERREEYINARLQEHPEGVDRYKEVLRNLRRVAQKAYREENREKRLEQTREWRKKHPEKQREYSRRYHLKNPEKARIGSRKRRARKLGAKGQHTAEDVKRMYEAQKGCCYYCGLEVGETYHVDHVIPLSRGGSDSPENLVVACPDCNRRKHDRMPHEWDGTDRLL